MAFIPRRNGKCDEPFVLKVNAAGDIVNGGLGGSIVCEREGDMLH